MDNSENSKNTCGMWVVISDAPYGSFHKSNIIPISSSGKYWGFKTLALLKGQISGKT
jgi:hypothetical protein